MTDASEAADAPAAIFEPPERFNMADHFLEARIEEGRGDRIALRTDDGELTYREVGDLARRFGNLLLDAGVQPEQRVLIALPDSPEFVGTLFGILKIGAVGVMMNPHLDADDVAWFMDYTRAPVVFTHGETADTFREAAGKARHVRELMVVGDDELAHRLAEASPELDTFPGHRDDPAIWLFSGGTTGRPKGVVQTHRSFANTAECYGKGVIGYGPDDVSISVPKLYFGYATGSNLLFPFSVGGSAVLFEERCTPEALFERIARHRPTILVNVPTMIQKMLDHPEASEQDLSSLRLASSAGEALPEEMYQRWAETFGVELLDGLGTAEMWHIFISNRPGAVKPGTLGTVVPGFEVKLCDDEGDEVPDGQVGELWVKGDSRALGYWQKLDATREAFRGEWYVSGDMLRRDQDGTFTYCGRADDMLKVSGQWLSPQEAEGCLLEHPAVEEVAVVGVVEDSGLTKPWAFVVPADSSSLGDTHDEDGLREELQAFVKDRLEPYKYPREVTFLDDLPRTHLGKVDRGRLKEMAG